MNNPEIISSIIQAVTSVVAIVIALASLYWTNKSQRDANKPYIVSYLQRITSSSTLVTYLIIKNFGKTGATITKVTTNPPLDSGNLKFDNNPFSNFENQIIAPGQSYAAGISINKSSSTLKTEKFEITISYLDQNSKIHEVKYPLDAEALHDVQRFIPAPSNGDEVAKSIYKTSAEKLINDL